MTTQSKSKQPTSSGTSPQPRPRFSPTATAPENTDFSNFDESGWIDVIQAPCYVSGAKECGSSTAYNCACCSVRYRRRECLCLLLTDVIHCFPFQFFDTLAELCLHPERNSTNILRADVISDEGPSNVEETQEDQSKHCKYTFTPPAGYRRTRSIRRRILPRRPTRDAPLEQDCTFYRSDSDPPAEERGLLVMVPHADTKEDVPYYHPVLRKLAFRYIATPPHAAASTTSAEPESSLPLDEQLEIRGTISISILPFAKELEPMTSTVPSAQLVSSDVLPNRTYRTCLHLLETLHKHGWGRMTGYQKRVVHDVRRDRWSHAYNPMSSIHVRHRDICVMDLTSALNR